MPSRGAMLSTKVLNKCGAACGCQLYLVVFTGAESSSVGRSFVLVSCLKFASKNFIPVSICQYDNEWAELWCETRRVIYVFNIALLKVFLSKGEVPSTDERDRDVYIRSQTHAKRGGGMRIYIIKMRRRAAPLAFLTHGEAKRVLCSALDAPSTK